VELTVAAVSPDLYVAVQSEHFEQVRFYVAVHVVLLALVFVEQAWGCWHAGAAEGATAVTSSTVVLLAAGLMYNVWVGVGVLARRDNAAVAGISGFTVRFVLWSALAVGVVAVALTLTLLTRAPSSATALFLTAADEPLYARYINALGMHVLRSMHDAFSKAQATSNGAYNPVSWLPVLPTSAADLQLEHVFPLSALKIFLSVIAGGMSIVYFFSAWRYANLLHDKLEENTEALNESSSGPIGVPGSAAAELAGEEESERLSTGARLRIQASSLVHVLNFLSPLFLASLWLPPFSSSLWLAVFSKRASAEVSESEASASVLRAWQSFEAFRVACVWACLLLRVVLLRSQLQVWLLSAMTAIRRMPAASAPSMEQHAAVRMQGILKAVFSFTPLVALQLLFPIAVSLLLLAAWKLAAEWVPTGAGGIIDASLARGGWGVCYAMVGRSASLFEAQHVFDALAAAPAAAAAATPSIVSAAAAVPVAKPNPSRLSAVDEDEFDGDLAALDDALEETPVLANSADAEAAAAAASAAASLGNSSLPVWSASSFVPPSRSNVLATALGFLLWWSWVAWFVASALCFLWIKTGAGGATATPASKAVTRVEVEHNVPAGDGGDAAKKAASGLRQRK